MNGDIPDNIPEKLWLPALRGRMGDWIYYVTLMKMKDLAFRVDVDQQVLGYTLTEYGGLEREMQKKVSEIVDYLLSQPQRFFSSSVIGVCGGAPRWHELSVQSNDMLRDEELPSDMEGTLGLLMLEGTEELFPIDGKQRLLAIRQALQANDSLGDEEVSVILVSHRTDSNGLERTLALFSTLSRSSTLVGSYASLGRLEP